MTTTTTNDSTTTQTDPAGAAAGAAAAGDLVGAGSAAASPGSLLTQQAENDYLPEKFRVTDSEGKIDQAASARKLAESYKALEAHKGPPRVVPATPEAYTLEAPKDAEGKPIAGFEEFTGDPLFKAFTADAHAQGFTNEQLQFTVGKYLSLAPELLQADKALTAEEATARLATVWTDQATMSANLTGVVRAINMFGADDSSAPGSKATLMEKYGTDPDFIAFAASIAKELKEDTPPGGEQPSSDDNIEALQKGKAYWDPLDPDHKRVKGLVDAHYAKRFAGKTR